jgi:hypothetical protein
LNQCAPGLLRTPWIVHTRECWPSRPARIHVTITQDLVTNLLPLWLQSLQQPGSWCRSLAASRAGDASLGRFLMTQARTAWRKAMDAHEAAAGRIERQHNGKHSFDPWHLDLHGLHSSEVWPDVALSSQPRACPRTLRSTSDGRTLRGTA